MLNYMYASFPENSWSSAGMADSATQVITELLQKKINFNKLGNTWLAIWSVGSLTD